jgi:transcriptional regulator with XRE-family HTH domain
MQDQSTPRRAISPAHHALGRAVRESRARRELSQEGLGFASGLHRNYVGALERGEVNPTFATLMRVSHGLGIALSTVVTVYERNVGEYQRQSGDFC